MTSALARAQPWLKLQTATITVNKEKQIYFNTKKQICPNTPITLALVQSATNTKVKSLQTREQIDKNTKMQDTESCKKTNHVMLLCDHKPRTTITRIANCNQCIWYVCIFRVNKKTRIPAAVISMCSYVTWHKIHVNGGWCWNDFKIYSVGLRFPKLGKMKRNPNTP